MKSQCYTNEAFTCVHHLYIIARVSADAVLHGCDNSMITCHNLFTQLHIRNIIAIIYLNCMKISLFGPGSDTSITTHSRTMCAQVTRARVNILQHIPYIKSFVFSVHLHQPSLMQLFLEDQANSIHLPVTDETEVIGSVSGPKVIGGDTSSY